MAGEPVELCASKTKVAISKGLKVMFCIGEKKEERENGTTMDVCKAQLEPLAKAVEAKDWESIAIAYEPGKLLWGKMIAWIWLGFILINFSCFLLCLLSLGHWNRAYCYSRDGARNSQKYSYLDFRKCLP